MTPSSSAPSAPDPNTEAFRRALPVHWNVRADALALLQERDGQYVYEVQGAERFILKAYPLSVKPEQLLSNGAVMDHLRDSGFPAPVVRRCTNGAVFCTAPGYRLLLQSYLPGVAPIMSQGSMALLGSLTARLHLLPVPAIESPIDPAGLKAGMYERAAQYGMPVSYWEQVAALPDFPALPRTLIHTDPELRNMIVDQTGNAFLIDWDDAGRGIALLDVAYPLVMLLREDGSYDEALYCSFYDAYTALRPLAEEERQLFRQAVAFWLLFYSVIPGVGIIGCNWTRARAWQQHPPKLAFL